MIDENIGVVKFVNNQTATFSLVSSATTTTANLQTPRTTPRFTDLHFDHQRKFVYIGNGTHIQNLSVNVDVSPFTGQVVGIPLVLNSSIRVNHTAFQITPDQYIATACFNCSGGNGTVQIWDSTNSSQNRLVFEIRGNSSQGSFMIGETLYLE